MEVLRITGGSPIRGTVEVPGSKNAALAVLSAVPMCSGRLVLTNVPDVSDVKIKLDLLRGFGVGIEWVGRELHLDCSQVSYWEPSEEDVQSIRTSFYLFGPLIARNRRAKLPMPGGCKIGARPVDFHLKGLEKLGATVDDSDGYYAGSADRLVGAEIYLDFPSAGATQHLMAVATLASGFTTIQNAAMEPEIVHLADFLRAMGARIEGDGTSTITIEGVSELKGCTFRVQADRLQAGTFLLAAAMTQGDVTATGIMPEHQTAVVQKLREAGIHAEEGHEHVRVWADQRPKGIRIKTMPYPGFPTDMQQPFCALLCVAEGTSMIEETIYESRIGHIPELNRMGANMRVFGRTTFIDGVERLHGARVEASDLRAGAALVLAALAADGVTTIRNVHFIDRGYERLEETFRSLGATIERVSRSEAASAL